MEKCLLCPPKNDSRGPNFELNYRRLLDGFKRGLPCRSRRLPAEGMARNFFPSRFKQFSPREIRIEHKKTRFPLPFSVRIHCRLKHIVSSPLFAPTTCVCPTPSPNSSSVSTIQQFSANLLQILKRSKQGGGTFFSNLFVPFILNSFIEQDTIFGDFGLLSRP